MKSCDNCKYDLNSINDTGCWGCDQYSNWKSRFRGKCYLAGGFFNDNQNEAITKIENLLDEYKDISVFSPRRDNDFNKIKGPRNNNDRLSCFNNDINQISHCDFMIVMANGFDTGTVFEYGIAYAIGKPIIYYNDNPEDLKKTRNLMLSFSCKGYDCHSIEDLKRILDTSDPTNYQDDENSTGRIGE